ncbi:transcriptional regulatory protein PtsJ [Klebsiella grimontii]|uniref:Transcriptional regulatory protein PtsJ n=1 Tax=Klebsiella grimontii TaxID=2058152 RepID=A0A7H4NZA3_9ENTR|nr:transcriptional regulatory protein PtsJ [Klebsiella grimontii]
MLTIISRCSPPRPWYSPIAAESQRWALVRSLSKNLGPDIRLAIVASDADTSAALRPQANSGSQWVSHLLQDLVIACLNDNAFMASLAKPGATSSTA